MSYDIASTFGHDQMKADGKRLFIETMSAADRKSVGPQVATDLQTLVESAWNTKGQTSGAMNLSRLAGYLGALSGLVGALAQAGFIFTPSQDKAGKPLMLVKLASETKTEGKPEAKPDMEELEGIEYETALAKMTPAERKKYMAEG